MPDHVEVRRGVYHDSVRLMQVSRSVGDVEGVDAALVAMGTELNLGLLDDMGFDGGVAAGPNDLLVALRARDDDAIETGLAVLARELAAPAASGRGLGGDAPTSRTTAAAIRTHGGDLVLVSVPGEHAATEALDAIAAGRHVMVFSDNVPVEAEVLLKTRARERGLLVMGPDCGTAIIGGVGLGFANVVRPGPVGVVAASGTGAQQLTCLLDDAGTGISHVLGVGGRDLQAEVGGIATLQAMELLDADEATEVIVILSKPPDPTAADRVLAAADGLSTPIVSGFIGPDADDLTAVASRVAHAMGNEIDPVAWESPVSRVSRPGHLKGWFAGGSLAAEALGLATTALPALRSNVGADPDLALADDLDAPGHVVVDLGDDAFTRGRPHPMIDQQLRLERIHAAGKDPDTAVLLLDVVLGHGAHPDPAGELAPAIASARDAAGADGRDLAVVITLCGTVADPQGRATQAQQFVDAGASVHTSNAQATRVALALLDDGDEP